MLGAVHPRRNLRNQHKGDRGTIHYLSLNAVADRTGIALSTLRTYRRDGRLPEPDATIGLEPNVRHGWLPETVDDWQTNRPGRGARTDLKS